MNLKNKLDYQGLRSRATSMKKVFFYRICGTGMGAAACLLKEKGYDVEGGDTNFYPPMSTYLSTTGIPCHQLSAITADYLKSFDLIVVGNVVPGSGTEARMIEELGVPFCSFPSAIGALVLADVNVIGIAGTHGKTTTTYLATQVFENLKLNPGYLIGGVMDGRPSSRLGSGKYFFIESDEYDSAYFEKISKFRSYSLDNMILTSLEFDHADIFSSVEDIKNQFKAALPNIDKKIIVNRDYSAIVELFTETEGINKKNWSFYGESSELGPKNVKTNTEGSTFEMNFSGKTLTFKTNVIGFHNILNLTAVIQYALLEGISEDAINDAIKDLQMVKRRQEERGFYKKALVIDDFAHHPRAVVLTIDAIKAKYPNKKIHVIMEPNSATARSAIFQKEFSASLDKADSVVFTKPTRPTSVKGVGDLDIYKITDEVKASGRPARVVGDIQELRQEIEKNIGETNLILILSNGTCLGLWESEFVKELQK